MDIRTSTEQRSVFTAPAAHGAFITQLYILQHAASRIYDKFIWFILERKTEAINAYFLKNSKREGAMAITRKPLRLCLSVSVSVSVCLSVSWARAGCKKA